MEKNRGRKSRVRVLLTAFEDDLLVTTQPKTKQNSAEFRGILRNLAAFRDTEFRIIPRNFRQFRMAYGIYGSNKNVRNSVLTEFRGHPK
jgi:hypothetical protein